VALDGQPFPTHVGSNANLKRCRQKRPLSGLFQWGWLSASLRIHWRAQAIAAPVAVDDIAVHIALSETVRHSRPSLQTPDHGDNVHASGGTVLSFGIILGGQV
jgi:hypothetical protein